MKKNYYELLEVPPDANQEQIKTAVIRLGKTYAALAQQDKTARAYFNQIKEAYKILSNPYRRAGYDDWLTNQQENLQKNWHNCTKQWAIKGWQFSWRQIIKLWKMGQQPVLQRKKIDTQQTITKSKVKEAPTTQKKSRAIKPQAPTKYLDKLLVPGERVMHQARTHWFFYVDFGAVLVVILAGYFLLSSPTFVGGDMPTVQIWVPKLISKDRLEVSVWYLGLMALLLVGLMMLWEAFVIGQTTELAVTSKRIFFKSGFLNRTMIEIKLRQFESIKIHQNILGLILNYGTVTIGGMGGAKTSVPNVVAPNKLRKTLWLVLDKIEQQDNRFEK